MRDECEHGMLRRKCDRCEEHAEIAALRAENEALNGEVEDAQRQRDGCRADASRMGQLWEQAVKDWKAAEAALAALRGEVRVVAESLVWTAWRTGFTDEVGETYSEGECCVDCGEYRPNHAPDCRLAALLKRVGP